MDGIQIPPRLALVNADEATVIGLRLMRYFVKLRDRRHREELVALAERLLNEEEGRPIEPAD